MIIITVPLHTYYLPGICIRFTLNYTRLESHTKILVSIGTGEKEFRVYSSIILLFLGYCITPLVHHFWCQKGDTLGIGIFAVCKPK